MKRIKSACLHLTLQFDSREAYDLYKGALKRKNTPYRIVSERETEDKGWLVTLKKPYNNYDCTEYLGAID